jgi:hypothetical protein
MKIATGGGPVALMAYPILTTSPRPIERNAEMTAGTSGAKSRRRFVGPQRDHHRSAGEVLLIGNALVNGNENVEASRLGSIKESAVLQPRQIGETGRLAVVVWKQKPEVLVNALIDQKPH